MHDSEEYGQLSIGGKPLPPHTIARRCGCTLDEYLQALDELKTVGVYSQTESGAIYSRRMQRDHEERAKNAERQRRHYEKGRTDSKPNGEPNADLTPISPGSSCSSSSSVSDSVSEGATHLRVVGPLREPASTANAVSASNKRGEVQSVKKAKARSASEPPGEAKPRRNASSVDDEYIADLQQNPAYSALSVAKVCGKMLAWCHLKKKPPTRARLLSWLNREDQPFTEMQTETDEERYARIFSAK